MSVEQQAHVGRVTAGIDWASADHAVPIVDSEGARISVITIARTAADLRRLVRTLQRAGVAEVAIERPDGLGRRRAAADVVDSGGPLLIRQPRNRTLRRASKSPDWKERRSENSPRPTASSCTNWPLSGHRWKTLSWTSVSTHWTRRCPRPPRSISISARYAMLPPSR
jgi:hypothetical protein